MCTAIIGATLGMRPNIVSFGTTEWGVEMLYIATNGAQGLVDQMRAVLEWAYGF